ncbi:uncharacterized protein LOC116120979 [Pistacia vera]|uniref:uncharacterized protein LOC116120979 n=1 Tax=Pistacia vera TaxID=55513 RepID=UPI0012639489|nr:uncharacterized protein LOC116120979 [Pistacia vera]
MVAFALQVAKEVEDEPRTVWEAMDSEDSRQWKLAMQEEYDSLMKNKTWILINKPEGSRVVKCKWVFKRKEGIPGVEAHRFKARFIANGFTQVEEVDYNEIFSPVVRHTTIRVLLSLVA